VPVTARAFAKNASRNAATKKATDGFIMLPRVTLKFRGYTTANYLAFNKKEVSVPKPEQH
jgi:hypothetical protein